MICVMDYFNEAFSGFEPHLDRQAAAKFALNALMMDDRVERLLLLIKPRSSISAVEGDPGWLLERRDTEAPEQGYERWPADAVYRAAVDPEAYALTYSEAFFDEVQFVGLVRRALVAYFQRQPQRKAALEDLCKLVGI